MTIYRTDTGKAEKYLSEEQLSEVIEKVQSCLSMLSDRYACRISIDLLHFKTRGLKAGVCMQRRAGNIEIGFNPQVFQADFEHHLNDTVGHEVAHAACAHLYPGAKPHGKEWKMIAGLLGVAPKATGKWNMQGVEVRRLPRVEYVCDCRSHWITSRIQNRMLKGIQYHCKQCRQVIVRRKAV